MVLSKLDKSINYKEDKKINEEDIDYETYVYSGNLFNKSIEFALGKPKYYYVEKNILFFYIYLINNKSVDINIGLFEILSSEYPNIIDEDGNVLLNKLNNSLIFNYVENYINKIKLQPKSEKDEIKQLEKEEIKEPEKQQIKEPEKEETEFICNYSISQNTKTK